MGIVRNFLVLFKSKIKNGEKKNREFTFPGFFVKKYIVYGRSV